MREFRSTAWIKEIYRGIKTYPEIAELFEQIIQAIYSAILNPADHAIDGGAHSGRHTIPMARLVDRGLVHAFEPVPQSASLLNRNAQLYGVERSILVHKAAISNYEGSDTFTIFAEDLSYSGLRKRQTPQPWQELYIPVYVTTIDRCVGANEKISFVKLDLEGGEFHAILGANNLIARSRPIIAFEHGKQHTSSLYDYTAQEFFGYFRSHSYILMDCFGTEMTEEVWSWEACWTPWYWIAIPCESPHQEAIMQAVNKVLVRYNIRLP